MTSPLLAVKYFVPRPRSGLTERPQLLARFEAGLERPLTLVSAPAGFGKSTLLSVCAARQRDRRESASAPGLRFEGLAWLSLDAADNDPARFWSYFVAALQTAWKPGEAPLERILELLQTDPPPPILPVLDALLNEITRRGDPLLMVLDDYHAILSPQVHEQVAYLVEHLPPNLHLVISTRSDPPLPVSRLRARGQLSEFRSADLRFTALEAAQFLNSMLGLEFTMEEIQAIEASTEGWIAGLQMAALALQAQVAGQAASEKDLREGIHRFIASFSGKHVFILDYLADEVFNRQPMEVQEFLLKTSILERMCAELCSAVIESRESKTEARHGSRSILEYLDRANLFVIPLDDQRTWFRYHHLFADLLRARLDQTRPDLKPELHTRASGWYERSGRVEEALNHALAAQDWDRAARLMEQHIQAFLERGQLSKVMDWIGRLPKEVAGRRPRLLIQQVWVMGFAQRIKEFASLLDSAGQSIAALDAGAARHTPAEAAEIVGLKANFTLMKAYSFIMLGNPDQALATLQEVEHILPPDGCAWERSWMHWMAGYANRALSRLDEAVAAFRLALQISREHGGLWNDMICCTDLGMVRHLQGNLAEARAYYLQALDLGRERRAPNHGYLNRVEAGLSAVLLDLNELEEAARHAETGLEWSQRWPSANARALAMVSLGRVRLAQGDLAGAAEVIGQAGAERRNWPLLPVNDSQVDAGLVRLWLARGDLAAARQWGKTFRETLGSAAPQPGQAVGEGLEMKLMVLARVLAARGKTEGDAQALDEAAALLETLEASAEKSGRIHSSIEAGVLRTVVLQEKAGRQGIRADSAALAALEKSLALAQEGGYIRVFVDEGEPVAEMLRAIRLRIGPSVSAGLRRDYVDALLAAFPSQASGPAGRQAAGMVEALTEREADVLRLLVQGLSNREIGEKLFVSEGTVKTHVHNLIGKLGVQSRTGVIARAKELGLV